MELTSPLDLPAVRVLGRHSDIRPLTLFYTGAGLEFCFTGSEVWIRLYADYGAYEPWISVELNGVWISRFPVAKGESDVCLFRGMTPGVPKRVRVFKDVQAMHEDPLHLLQVIGLRYDDGEFPPLPEPRFRLEFVGDSITSGEGAVGAQGEEDWVSAFFGAYGQYTRMTADLLGADYRIVSQSGWGLVSGWDNNPCHRVMPYYEQICGLAAGPRNAALGAQEPNRFAAWPADAVIINLGTNDGNAMANPAWPDPPFQQTDTAQGRARVEQAAVDTLKTLRRCNPRAALVWAYGMLGDGMRPVLQSAVSRYRAETGDMRAWYLPLPAATPQTLGARRHPGRECHRQAAEILSRFLTEKLTE